MSQVHDFFPKRRRGRPWSAVGAAAAFVGMVVLGIAIGRALAPTGHGPGPSTPATSPTVPDLPTGRAR